MFNIAFSGYWNIPGEEGYICAHSWSPGHGLSLKFQNVFAFPF